MTELPPQMPALVESISEAKSHFSAIVDSVGEGKVYVICRAGRPVAVLSPYKSEKKSRRIGILKGRLNLSKDWYERDQAHDREIEKLFAVD